MLPLSSFFSTLLTQVPSAEPGTDMFGWLLELLRWVVEQFKQKNYVPGMGGVVMVLVFFARMFLLKRLNSNVLPLVSAGLGVLLACGVNLAGLAVGSQPMDWLSALAMGLTTGAAASGFWSLVGKKLSEKFLPVKGE
jgi:UDP-N-acetylmuramyl pentapeptide phosphotransferase/UDP-N-acetylglucosamine-1-phosphate transferase